MAAIVIRNLFNFNTLFRQMRATAIAHPDVIPARIEL
jgi:hypothetical protein